MAQLAFFSVKVQSVRPSLWSISVITGTIYVELKLAQSSMSSPATQMMRYLAVWLKCMTYRIIVRNKLAVALHKIRKGLIGNFENRHEYQYKCHIL